MTDQTAMDRGAKAEALLLHFTAEAHRRKWAYDRGVDDDGVPIKSEAFNALHQLGEEMRVELDKLHAAIPAGQAPATDRAALVELGADAIREAACPGSNCPHTEEECAEKRIQPAAWERGVLSEVYGRPEWFADAVLTVLPAPTDRAAALREAADHFASKGRVVLAASQAANELRRMAEEAQQDGAQS